MDASSAAATASPKIANSPMQSKFNPARARITRLPASVGLDRPDFGGRRLGLARSLIRHPLGTEKLGLHGPDIQFDAAGWLITNPISAVSRIAGIAQSRNPRLP